MVVSTKESKLIISNNITIARYMGYGLSAVTKTEGSRSYTIDTVVDYGGKHWPIENLYYHKKWDWLMPVYIRLISDGYIDEIIIGNESVEVNFVDDAATYDVIYSKKEYPLSFNRLYNAVLETIIEINTLLVNEEEDEAEKPKFNPSEATRATEETDICPF